MIFGPGIDPILGDPLLRNRLANFIVSSASANACVISGVTRLDGGAIQENYALDLEIFGGPFDGFLSTVLRTSAPTGVADSHDRMSEFTIMLAIFDVGVLIPRPLWCCDKHSIIGKPFSIMVRAPGEARGDVLAYDTVIEASAEIIAEQLGLQLAKIHSITPDTHHFDCMTPHESPELISIAHYRAQLEQNNGDFAAIEWGLRWLERNSPAHTELVLLHRDYRLGNFLFEKGELTAILDWEFAGWGDPHEDIGWLCAQCWRVGNTQREVGGIANRALFYKAYQDHSGRKVDPSQVFYWEVYAHVRWAMLALQQADRYLVGGELNLDAALSGHRLAELETAILRMTPPESVLI